MFCDNKQLLFVLHQFYNFLRQYHSDLINVVLLLKYVPHLDKTQDVCANLVVYDLVSQEQIASYPSFFEGM